VLDLSERSRSRKECLRAWRFAQPCINKSGLPEGSLILTTKALAWRQDTEIFEPKYAVLFVENCRDSGVRCQASMPGNSDVSLPCDLFHPRDSCLNLLFRPPTHIDSPPSPCPTTPMSSCLTIIFTRKFHDRIRSLPANHSYWDPPPLPPSPSHCS